MRYNKLIIYKLNINKKYYKTTCINMSTIMLHDFLIYKEENIMKLNFMQLYHTANTI